MVVGGLQQEPYQVLDYFVQKMSTLLVKNQLSVVNDPLGEQELMQRRIRSDEEVSGGTLLQRLQAAHRGSYIPTFRLLARNHLMNSLST